MKYYEIGYGYEYQCLKVDRHSSSNVVFLGSQFYLLPGPGPSLGKKVIHQDPSLIKLLSEPTSDSPAKKKTWTRGQRIGLKKR